MFDFFPVVQCHVLVDLVNCLWEACLLLHYDPVWLVEEGVCQSRHCRGEARGVVFMVFFIATDYVSFHGVTDQEAVAVALWAMTVVVALFAMGMEQNGAVEFCHGVFNIQFLGLGEPRGNPEEM